MTPEIFGNINRYFFCLFFSLDILEFAFVIAMRVFELAKTRNEKSDDESADGICYGIKEKSNNYLRSDHSHVKHEAQIKSESGYSKMRKQSECKGKAFHTHNDVCHCEYQRVYEEQKCLSQGVKSLSLFHRQHEDSDKRKDNAKYHASLGQRSFYDFPNVHWLIDSFRYCFQSESLIYL